MVNNQSATSKSNNEKRITLFRFYKICIPFLLLLQSAFRLCKIHRDVDALLRNTFNFSFQCLEAKMIIGFEKCYDINENLNWI